MKTIIRKTIELGKVAYWGKNRSNMADVTIELRSTEQKRHVLHKTNINVVKVAVGTLFFDSLIDELLELSFILYYYHDYMYFMLIHN